MKIFVFIFFTALCVSCTTPITFQPTNVAIDIIVLDEREKKEDFKANEYQQKQLFCPPYIPGFPYHQEELIYYSKDNFTYSVVNAVDDLKIFNSITAIEDPKTSEAPYQLVFTIEKSTSSTTTTNYCLGPLGLLLHFFTLPREYHKVEFTLSAVCLDKESNIIHKRRGFASKTEAWWIYTVIRSPWKNKISLIIGEAVKDSLKGIGKKINSIENKVSKRKPTIFPKKKVER